MEDIKAILKENFEHYDEECQKLLKYTEEKDPGFEERSKYAGFLKEPVRKKQILFWSRGWKSCADVPNYLFEQLYQMYGEWHGGVLEGAGLFRISDWKYDFAKFLCETGGTGLYKQHDRNPDLFSEKVGRCESTFPYHDGNVKNGLSDF